MGNASALDRIVWDEFFANTDRYIGPEDMADERSGFGEMAQEPYIAELPLGMDVITLAKTRKNQGFFREMILASYDMRCALTDIAAPELLVASHIVPWATDEKLRMNPQNGICLNALHDRAFDRGLISFSDDLSVLYSPHLPAESLDRLREIAHPKMKLPKRFRPASEFLEHHRNNIFRG